MEYMYRCLGPNIATAAAATAARVSLAAAAAHASLAAATTHVSLAAAVIIAHVLPLLPMRHSPLLSLSHTRRHCHPCIAVVAYASLAAAIVVTHALPLSPSLLLPLAGPCWGVTVVIVVIVVSTAAVAMWGNSVIT